MNLSSIEKCPINIELVAVPGKKNEPRQPPRILSILLMVLFLQTSNVASIGIVGVICYAKR